MTDPAQRPPVRGLDLDPQTRCAHWRGERDIIAIRMRCCATFFACRECHDALADHDVQVWPKVEWGQPAVLCGACGHELTVREYLDCDSRCPSCGSAFNPGCKTHHHFYFEPL